MRIDRIGGPGTRSAPVPAVRRPSRPRREDEREPDAPAPEHEQADQPTGSAAAPARPRLDLRA